MKQLHFYIIALFLLITLSANAQKGGEFSKKLYVQNGDTLKYQIMYPKNYDKNKEYPLVLFLHGAGERGSDNERQLVLGSHIFLDKQNQKDFPAIVLCPQCPDGVMWTHRQKFKMPDRMVFEFPVTLDAPRPAQLVNSLVEELIADKMINTKRMYIMGISMGGIATLEFLFRWPEKYAAAYVVCGGHNPDLARYYAETPIWFAHGDKDNVVPIEYARAVYEEVYKINHNSRFKVYPGVNHGAWTPAFKEKDLFPWLFQFEKK